MELKPFYIFLTGGADIGKSHVIKTVTMSLNKGLMNKSENPDKAREQILVPSGVVAINIDETTAHSVSRIGIGKGFLPLNDKQREIRRNKLSEVQLIIIDKIYMVSSVL